MEDTETLIALLSSLIHPLTFDQDLLIETLVRCDGNVQDAAQQLRARGSDLKPQSRIAISSRKENKKRKRKSDLNEWLNTSPSKSESITAKRPVFQSTIDARAKNAPKRESEAPRDSQQAKKSSSSMAGGSDVQVIEISDDESHPTSPIKTKTVSKSEFMAILRPPNSSESPSKLRGPPKFPPLTLATPALVFKHTPCTLHPSVLPPELACRLFFSMLADSEEWQKNKWWLFDRVVESPHRTSFFARRSGKMASSNKDDLREAAQYWYNGRQTPMPDDFSPAMEEACKYVERVVNAEMRKRKRYPLEWAGEPPQVGDVLDGNVLWRANVAAANCYTGGKESVGFHSDQLTHLGPHATIASLSLGTTREFRLREVIPADEKDKRSARTYNIPLSHNSLLIMHGSTQETFKHTVPPQRTIDMFHPPFPPPESLLETLLKAGYGPDFLDFSTNVRINITFRFYRPDFRASTTPRCRCGVPCILRPDMKNRHSDPSTSSSIDSSKDLVAKYWWTCYAGAQNDGKGCGFWKVMDAKAEGRGPFVCDMKGESLPTHER